MKIIGHSLLNMTLTISIFTSSCNAGKMETSEENPDVSSPRIIMKFEREGGYFGCYDAFLIYADGRVMNSAGETARIPPDLVTRWWAEAISPVTVQNSREEPSFQQLAMDCYTYRITVYKKGETRVLSASCTDKYPFDENGGISVFDMGRIRETLMSLSWERTVR